MWQFFHFQNYADVFLGLLSLLLIGQLIILFRIRKALQRVLLSFDSFSTLFRKITESSGIEETNEELPPICQFCKHRLAYIHSNSSGEQEQFYYKCGLKNIQIGLYDSCERFDADELFSE